MTNVIKLSASATGEFWGIPVLHQDAALLALDKPAGLSVSADPHDPDRPSLVKLLHEGAKEGKSWARHLELDFLMNANWLDDDTSGVLVLARNRGVLAALGDLFGSEKPVKRYVALVRGVVAENEFEVAVGLSEHTTRPEWRIDFKRGKRSKTRFKVREKFSNWALLDCEAITDRPHQIRVHLMHAGLPLIGDRTYGGSPLLLSRLKRGYRPKDHHQERPLVGRVALHLERVDLVHPLTKCPLVISAPLPKDFTVALKYLRRFAVAGSPAGEGTGGPNLGLERG